VAQLRCDCAPCAGVGAWACSDVAAQGPLRPELGQISAHLVLVGAVGGAVEVIGQGVRAV
jgi:hypothetical protein